MRLLRLPMVARWAKSSDAIIIGSSPMRSLPAKAGWKAVDDIFVIPYGVDSSYFKTDPVLDRKGLLYAGSWLHRKGIHVLVDAFSLLSQRGRNLPLSIIGHGAHSERILGDFEPAVRGLVTADETWRQVEEATLMEEYRRHEILLFPSLYEGFGMVFLEAMASGMAVIASPTGGVPDIIRHNENGYVVPAGDPEALASAVEELLKHPEKRESLGLSARLTARQLTWERIADRTLDCYRTVARRSLGRALL